MGLFKKKAENLELNFFGTIVNTENLPQIPIKTPFTVALANDTITIMNKDMSFTVSKSQITGVGTYNERETVLKGKSVVGRSLIGAAIAGPTGALVGGLSGTKDKKKTVQHSYWYMCFTSSTGQSCRLDIQPITSMLEVQKFNRAVAPQNNEPVPL